MGQSRGLRGQLCPICKINPIKTQDALTCSATCGIVLRCAKSAQLKSLSINEGLRGTSTTLRYSLPSAAKSAAETEIASLRESSAKSFPALPRQSKKVRPGRMLEISIPDLHVGKLAWAKETGWDNYDVNIALACHADALQALLSRATASAPFEKILLVVGNDLLNADNLQNSTTAGTTVTTDVRFQRTFALTRDLMIATIETLRAIAPVHVVMVPGNHDQLSVWHLGDSLYCWYHKCPDVQIDNSPLPRKYVQFGTVMLMFTHGNKGKRADYPLLMATEQPTMFGSSSWREAHTGHNHQTRLEEHHGVRVRILPALCAPDDWHAENGMVGNLRSAEAYIWDKEEGLIGTAQYNVPASSARDKAKRPEKREKAR